MKGRYEGKQKKHENNEIKKNAMKTEKPVVCVCVYVSRTYCITVDFPDSFQAA